MVMRMLPLHLTVSWMTATLMRPFTRHGTQPGASILSSKLSVKSACTLTGTGWKFSLSIFFYLSFFSLLLIFSVNKKLHLSVDVKILLVQEGKYPCPCTIQCLSISAVKDQISTEHPSEYDLHVWSMTNLFISVWLAYSTNTERTILNIPVHIWGEYHNIYSGKF